MSLRPVLDSVVKLRKRSSIHVRSAVGSLAAMKLSGVDRLDHRVGVREAPGHEREGGADGVQLVARDGVVGEHVADERAGGVEVEDDLERRGVRQQVVLARDRPG
jgi:hypothetical protein